MGYPKLKEANKCAFPERDECNYGEKEISREQDFKTGITTIKNLSFSRCQYMTFVSVGNWTCSYKGIK